MVRDMSLETRTEEKITPEQIDVLIQKASDTELKYLLLITREERVGGCGYLYLYSTEVDVVYGDTELVTLERKNISECEWREKILAIPKTIPTIVRVSYRDDNPEISDFDEFFIFTSEGWKSLRVEVPK